MAENAEQLGQIEPPRGRHGAKVDEKGRMKFPTAFQEYIATFKEKKLFVTSLDRSTAQVFPIAVWRKNEDFFQTYKADPEVADRVNFNAQDLGSETEMDSQGRIVFSTDLRRELGIEDQPVHLYAYNGRIEVLSETMYQAKRSKSTASPEADVKKLREAGLNG